MPEYSVLIIDDDIWMQRILSKSLQSYGFTKSLLASNGFDGVAIAVENRPNIIILDILMPDLTGLQTLKLLKTIKATKNIPVLMVSALSDAENLGMAVRSGSAGFISKPFTRATIYDKLVEVFGKERLLQISRGEEFFEVPDSTNKMNEFERKPSNVWNSDSYKETNSPINEEKSDESFKLPSESINKAYPSDEKKTLESIKKMLLKSKP